MDNVLFINYGGIGDEILFLPTLQGFKKLYPNSKITLCLENRAKGIMGLCPLIDDVITVDIKAGGIKKYLNILKLIFKTWTLNFDTVISSGKSPFVAIILFLMKAKKKIGYRTKTSFLLTDDVPLNENCYAGNMYFDLIKPLGEADFELPKISYDPDFQLEENFFENDFILLHPGVSLMSIKKNIFKCPKKELWVDLIKRLLSKGEKVVLAGGPDDADVINFILQNKEITNNPNFCSMFGKTKNLYQMAGLIKKSKKLICCDSAPLHLGVGLNKEIIVFFGPTNEEKLVPKKESIKVISKKINCRPCLWHKRAFNCEKSECLNFDINDVIECMK